ncbi:MAG: glycosyltransferase [Cognatishimia sp.]|uniref:glycosyltransferase family 2 protein n=1 Tax=Cognatishimia sp. TaxID=2211648 RepID=UPI003B8B45DB
MKQEPYFHHFCDRVAPEFQPLSEKETVTWQLLASITIGFGFWYLSWRWLESLNPEAMGFSVLVASCETLAFCGTLIFYYDIWAEKDSFPEGHSPPKFWSEKTPDRYITVDIFLTTFDEPVEVVEPSISAAKQLAVNGSVSVSIYLLDDGDRGDMQDLASRCGINYLSRSGNRGFKAGNLANALLRTDGEYFVICDADTRLFPSFLSNTLAYFQDPKVSWVQTPHWFYDLSEGRRWEDWLANKIGEWAVKFAPFFRLVSGSEKTGADHFHSDPTIFFDLIQRRRNRNGASFCCGAGSIHRREAVLQNALLEKAKTIALKAGAHGRAESKLLSPRIEIQPFKYHVSEDIFTSIQAHTNGWKSVYHPKIEAQMLSPWSVSAWAIQKLKYAGGTFDILLNANPLWNSNMPWRVRLHYLATFWSYLSVFILSIMVLSPAYSLLTGYAPIESFSVDFFARLLPLLICNELAMSVTSKGASFHRSKVVAFGTIAIQLRAFFLVALGRKPKFPTTPKLPDSKVSIRFALPNLILLSVLGFSIFWGVLMYCLNRDTHSLSFLIVNVFWLSWSLIALLRMTLSMLSNPALPTKLNENSV